MFACCIRHELPEGEHVISENARVKSEYKKERKKEVWIGKLDFFMSVMGFNIGLGNLLRFPYLCMKNGGGAFLIPYFFFLVTIGIPMFLMEMSLAQYSGLTPLEFYGNICPLFKGIGWCNVITCSIYNIYYNMMMAWILYYIGASVFKPLPWSTCNNYWNTDRCLYKEIGENVTKTCSMNEKIYFSPAEEYWEQRVLKISDRIGNLGSVNGLTVLCLVISWITVFICCFKGIKSMGRVVYFTALSPYIFLLILLVRGFYLEGSTSGITFYLNPNWPRLLEPKIWLEAGQQIFWSLAPGWGITISLASHNMFNHNIVRDSVILPVVSCLTSFLGGFVIFSFLGHISHRHRVPISCVFKVGPGLAFGVYPEALQTLQPIPQLWCFMFFILLFILGLDSSFTSFECVYDSLIYNSKFLYNHSTMMKLVIISVSIMLAIPFTMNGGYYLYQLLDYYQVAFLPLVVLVEIYVITHIYGFKRIKTNIKVMTNYEISSFFDFHCKYILPILLFLILVFTLYSQGNLKYGTYIYPVPAAIFGWFIAVVSFIGLPTYTIYHLWKLRRSTPNQTLTLNDIKAELKATSYWEQRFTQEMEL